MNYGISWLLLVACLVEWMDGWMGALCQPTTENMLNKMSINFSQINSKQMTSLSHYLFCVDFFVKSLHIFAFKFYFNNVDEEDK